MIEWSGLWNSTMKFLNVVISFLGFTDNQLRSVMSQFDSYNKVTKI